MNPLLKKQLINALSNGQYFLILKEQTPAQEWQQQLEQLKTSYPLVEAEISLYLQWLDIAQRQGDQAMCLQLVRRTDAFKAYDELFHAQMINQLEAFVKISQDNPLQHLEANP